MQHLCFSITFLNQCFHGRGEDGDPEWPPSPLRLMQALVAAAAGRWNERMNIQQAASALKWLETLPPPDIIAPAATPASLPYRLYVPDNVMDRVAASWSRGNDASIADYRTEKDVLPVVIDGDGKAVHYVYRMDTSSPNYDDFIKTITLAARSITHLGWGIDLVVGNASSLTAEEVAQLQGVRWRPSPKGGLQLRTPQIGTLDDLTRKHTDFLRRVGKDGFRPVPPLREFNVTHYRSQDDLFRQPYRVFELRDYDGARYRYSHRRLIHIAGMVRHLAIGVMEKDPPRGVADDWVETYVAGHAVAGSSDHSQVSYIPLQSIGTDHTDPGVRRVMIMAPVGDDARLDHLARRLSGLTLKPVRGDEFGNREPPLLVPVRNDNVARFYTKPSSTWASVTPVILPGHDDHKPAKTRKLIEKTLRQAGIERPCSYEYSPFSRFRKSFSAHKYDKSGRPQGYFRPDHLLHQTAVHLTLRFHDGTAEKNSVSVPGPIAIGSGRHCGLGILAGVEG